MSNNNNKNYYYGNHSHGKKGNKSRNEREYHNTFSKGTSGAPNQAWNQKNVSSFKKSNNNYGGSQSKFESYPRNAYDRSPSPTYSDYEDCNSDFFIDFESRPFSSQNDLNGYRDYVPKNENEMFVFQGARKKTHHNQFGSNSNGMSYPNERSGYYPRNIPEHDYGFMKNGNNTGSPKQNAKKSSVPIFCIDCDVVVDASILHKHFGHKKLDTDEGVRVSAQKKLKELKNTQNEITSRILRDNLFSGALDIWEAGIAKPLIHTFHSLKSACENESVHLTCINDDVKSLMSSKSTSFVHYLSLKKSVDDINFNKQALLSTTNQMPFWLVSSWLKTTIGMLLHSNRNIKCVLNRRTHEIFAPLSLQGDRILFHCFRRNVNLSKNDLVLPYEYFRAIFEEEKSGCFLSLTYDGRNEGFMVVRIDSDTLLGTQFMTMCTGEEGPSYRHNRFFRSCGHGTPGHHAFAGDYTRNDGSGGNSIISPDDTIPLTHRKPVIAGIFAARPGFNDRSTIFRIFLSGTGDKNELVDAFGYAEEGMDFLTYALQGPSITKLAISDAGRVIPLG